ncbi:MAG: hypothetical protein HY301_03115 [Verrucomicrobia bacterium]|nr:hypothetical protein [Verrucomicrobiota bacterium]
MTSRLNPERPHGGAGRFATAHWPPFLLAVLLAVGASAQLAPDGGTNTLDGVTNTVTGSVTVGTNGSFTLLTLTNGALLTNTLEGQIGLNAGANSNTILVSGVGTSWMLGTNAAGVGLYVGNGGAFNALTISDGGNVTSRGGRVGNTASAGTNLVVITGGGSLWSNWGELVIGYAGAGNRVVVSNGGSVLTFENRVGVAAAANDNSILVTGSASSFTTVSYFNLGEGSSGNNLLVNDGATFGTVNNSVLGSAVGANSNSAVVSDASSFWKTGNLFLIGNLGSFNSVMVSNGATVSNASVTALGYLAGANSNLAMVTGGNSRWISADVFTIGNRGSANLLSVNRGASVVSGSGQIGAVAGANQNSAVVTGAGSTWSNSGILTIGNGGSFNQLLVSNGGAVVAGGAINLGSAATGTNNSVVAVGGSLSSAGLTLGGSVSRNNSVTLISNSTWNVGGGIFTWGNAGVNDTLNIDAASALTNIGGLTLDENDTLFYMTNDLGGYSLNGFTTNQFQFRPSGLSVVNVGNGGTNVQLLISNYTLSDSMAWIGNGASARSNAVIVTGPGSVWSNSSTLIIGNSSNGASGNQMMVSDGAKVFDTTGTLGNRANCSNNFALVTGPGSVWNNASAVTIGSAGSFNRLVISNSGVVLGGSAGTVGGTSAGNSNSVLVTGAGSLWTNNGTLIIGNSGAFNQLVISNGGVVAAFGAATIGNAATGDTNLVLVTGPGSVWSNLSALGIGAVSGASANQLVVSNGGTVFNTTGTLGTGANSSNNLALVTGTGSVWSNNGLLTIGNSGPRTQLIVSDGGAVFAAALTMGALPGTGSNRVTIDGGSLIVTNPAGTGIALLNRGTNVLNSGYFETDQLVLTNKVSGVAHGVFEFNGGTLITRGTTNANGLPFTVGNGASAATFQLLGGTHSFANGLVLASNSLLKGNGTILGAVTNFGTIAPGSSPGALTINGSLSLRSSANLSFELGGLLATNQYDVLSVTNFVELAGTLSLSLLNGFYPAAGDSFTVFNYGSATGAFGNVSGGGRLNTVDNLGSFLVTLSATNVVVGGYVSPDSDGDGQSDYAETLAGTNPNDPASALTLTPISVGAGGAVTLRFPFVAGKSYRLLYSDNLASGVWNVIAAPVFTQPSAGINQWVDDGTLTGGLAATTRAYRVGLQ